MREVTVTHEKTNTVTPVHTGTYGSPGPRLYNLDGFEPEPALPVLAETQMARIPVDPSVGFATGRVNPDMDGSVAYFITDGVYFVLVLSTDEGVVLVDAPQSMAATLVPGVKAIAGDDAVVSHLVYSHSHQDHISGTAAVLDAHPGAQVWPRCLRCPPQTVTPSCSGGATLGSTPET